jgi:hypothetical protein
MAGNVWEWTASERSHSSEKAIKGGAWLDPGTSVHLAREGWAEPGDKGPHIGFRCAWSSDPEGAKEPGSASDLFDAQFWAPMKEWFPGWNS